MKYLFPFITLIMVFPCSKQEKVLYEELTPAEFSSKIDKCPVAYLPLGTLEWQGPHLPLGSDAIQSQEFFERLAIKFGGIVLPKLFVDPDGFDTIIDRKEYYGMDCAKMFIKDSHAKYSS